ncbi:peptidoglycan-binding protein [Aureliella helgolandensis]|nr:peptidoglycan-binding protein [Aureliella helgolandensis]
MSEFVWLRHGDRLPSVVVAQMLLNRTGESLGVDGIYGSRTAAAVKKFQREHRPLTVDGVIGQNTWPRLIANEHLQILDCIDVFDESLFKMEVGDLRRSGASPVLIGGMCNGIEQAICDIRGRANNLFLLRFHGHGAPGAAGVSDGHGSIEDHSTFRNDTATRNALSRLRGCFGSYGCIQFMHCNTAQGAQGTSFLRMVSSVTGVPASAGVDTQFAGTLRKTVRFEGPTRTFCPSGGAMRSWATTLPQFAGMSIA